MQTGDHVSAVTKDLIDRILRSVGLAALLYVITLFLISGLPENQVPSLDGDTKTDQSETTPNDTTASDAKNNVSLRAADHVREPLRRISYSKDELPIQSYGMWFDRDGILADEDRRVSEDFMIPPALAERVGFWFDIYSRYDSHKRVIHHTHYPWVIFKVVDVEPIISATYPRFRWMRNQIADDVVKKEMANVRKALDSLASKKHVSDLDSDKLTETELQAKRALEVLGKDVRRLAKAARREVRVQTGQRNHFAEGLQMAPRYLPAMEDIFRKHKLPVDLTRLPLVESSFNKHAKSKVGAAGIWQFMENTGKKKKLVINELVDERKSPFKATDAAARLLKENHMILGRSWELAVTAWNHGPGGVKLASRAAGSRDLARIIEVYHSRRFSFASENFYASFLAALFTERYSDRIFPGLPRLAPLEVEELRLTRKMDLEEIMSVTSLSLEDFVAINPDLQRLVKAKKTLHKGLRILVPTESKSAVELKMAGESEKKRLIGANG